MESTQIYLEAAEQRKKIDDLWEQLIDNKYDPSIQVQIAGSIRFFGKNVGKLQESNESMLKLARAFLFVSNENLVQWSLRDSNAFLLMITSLLLKRKDEVVIRQTCSIMKEFTSLMTEAQLKNLVKIHQKETKFIFNKISKVSTYFTQMKLLEVLHIILRVLDDGGAKVIQQERIVTMCSRGLITDTVSFFNDLDLSNFLHTSRNFLDFYNQEIIKSPFVLTTNCFLFELNGRRMQPKEFTIDFNMRNLSISFFLNAGILRNSKSKDLAFTDYFVELEECELEAQANRFSDPDHIELRLTPSRSQVLDKNDKTVSELSQINSLLLVLTQNPELFWKTIYPTFKEKKPLLNDNQTDLESLASYRTFNTFIDNHDKEVSSKPQEKSSVVIESKLPTVEEVKPNMSADLFTASECDVTESQSFTTANQLKKEPKVRKTAKVGPQVPVKVSLNQKPVQSVYDDVPRDEEALPPLSKFLTQKRAERQNQSQSQVIENTETTVPDNSADLDWKPNRPTTAETKKPLAKKRSTPNSKKITTPGAKTNPPKPRSRAKTSRRSSTDIEDEVKEAFGEEVFEALSPAVAPGKRTPRQKAAETNKKAQKKTVKKETTFDTSDGDMDVVVVQTIAEQKRNAVDKKKQVVKAESGRTVQARRNVLSEIKESDNKAKQVPQKKPPQATKKTVSDFDALLNDKKKTTALEPKLDTMSMRLAKKRVAFDDSLKYIKRSRTSSIESDHSATPFEPFTQRNPEQNKENIAENFDDAVSDEEKFSPYTQRQLSPKEQEKEVVYNFGVLEKKHMLGKYIQGLEGDQMDIDQDVSYDEMVITNTQHISKKRTSPNRNAFDGNTTGGYEIARHEQIRVQKKTSPTIIRTVQIQEINYTQSENNEIQEVEENRTEDELCRQFKAKASEALEPLIEEIRKLRGSIGVLKRPELKAKLHQAVANCRNSKDRFRTHVHEHVKLLKRLHHSKRQLTQLYDEDMENVSVLRKTVKQASDEGRKACKEGLQKVNDIRAAALEKQEEIKQEVWQSYINGIENTFLSVIKKYSVI